MMKKLITNPKFQQILLLLTVLVLASCRNKNQVEDAIELFFLIFLMIVNVSIFGTLGLVFSILAYTNGKPALRTAGLIIMILYTLIFILTLKSYAEVSWSEAVPLVFLIIELAILGIGWYFIAKKPAVQPDQKKDQVLDDIIDEKDEIV